MLRNGATKRRNGARLAFALIFLFATLLIAASGVSFAKKLSSSSGGDNAQVSSLIVDLWGSSSDNLTIDCGQGVTAAAYNFAVANTKDGKTVTFTDVGRFEAGNSQTHYHTMVFSVVDASFLLRDYVFTNTSVSVRAEQIC